MKLFLQMTSLQTPLWANNNFHYTPREGKKYLSMACGGRDKKDQLLCINTVPILRWLTFPILVSDGKRDGEKIFPNNTEKVSPASGLRGKREGAEKSPRQQWMTPYKPNPINMLLHHKTSDNSSHTTNHSLRRDNHLNEKTYLGKKVQKHQKTPPANAHK